MSYAPEPGQSGSSGNLFEGESVAGEAGTNVPFSLALNPGSGYIYWSVSKVEGVYFGQLTGGTTDVAGSSTPTDTQGVGVVDTAPTAGITSSSLSTAGRDKLAVPLSCASAKRSAVCNGHVGFDLGGHLHRVRFKLTGFGRNRLPFGTDLTAAVCQQLRRHHHLRVMVTTQYSGGSTTTVRIITGPRRCE